MNWIQFISHLQGSENNQYIFNSAVPHFLLQDLQIQFELQELPPQLFELYKETNGVEDSLDGTSLIWTIERVIESNKEYRSRREFKSLYMSFDQLFFISDAGNGDLFGFVTLNGRFDRHDIFAWNHEDDSRTWVAPDLAKFIEWWTNGTIKV